MITVDMPPRYCPQCGSDAVIVEIVKSKSRVTAEMKMAELDDLRPQLEAAWNAYYELRTAYEDRMQFLVVYKRRGIVSESEWLRYRIDWKSELNDELKKYRAGKRGER